MHQRTVLLLEKEPVIAFDLRTELEANGCQVLAAEDGQDAVQLSQQHGLDLAILNFHFKDSENGMEIARRMRLGPQTKLLFLTGVNPQDAEPPSGFQVEYQIIHKPFARRQLHAVLLP